MALNKVKRDALALEMDKRKYFDCIEMERAKIDSRNKFQNLNRFMQIQRKELEEAKMLEDQQKAAALKVADVKNEENLAEALNKMSRDELNELRRRQILRQSSHELRDLESKLRAAYVNKQLRTQLAEKKAERMENKLREKEANEKLQSAIINQLEMKAILREENMKQKAKYRQELQDQMVLQERNKRYLYDEFLREKKMIDDIIQRIHDEDERALEEKMCKMQKTKQEMIAFKEAQEVWKQKQTVEHEDENRRVQEYLQQKAREEHNKKKLKHIEEARKLELTEAIAKEMYKEQHDKNVREYYLQELLEEEYNLRMEERYKQDMENKLRRGIDTRVTLMNQMAEKQERLRKEAEHDAIFQEQLMAKMVEDQRLDQLSTQKKRMKMLQLRRDVEQMMIERRQKRAEDKQQLLKLEDEANKAAEEKKRIIEEERMKMLKEHAQNLIGFMPRGILREDDLPHLGSEVMELYGKKDSNEGML